MGWGTLSTWEWYKSEEIRREVTLEAFVIMPNHIHGVVIIQPQPANDVADPVGTQGLASLQTPKLFRPKRSLSTFVSGFKSAATKSINLRRGTPGLEVWQKRHHDRIIRGERELQAIRTYIEGNPMNWPTDTENQPSEKLWAQIASQ